MMRLKRSTGLLFFVIMCSGCFSQNSSLAQEARRSTIINPVIRGFNPDPSIIRVKDDYYIAVSSFEWFPGIPIYHSRDLANWELVGHGITNTKQADLRGVPPSGGVYAPMLAYHKEYYYLVYTTVMTSSDTWPVTATPNFIIKAKDVKGPWSDPVYLHSVGFDPSIFFDDDGKAYILSMVMDFRTDEPKMGKIMLQEYSIEQEKLVGEPVIIFNETEMWGTEGPHIYKKDGKYFLMLAQGGTFYDHQVSLARADHLLGPYEKSTVDPILTSKNDSTLRLQRAGHGSLVQTPDNRWYMAHLASRSLMPARKSPLGRETAIQEVEWTADGWLQLVGGGTAPKDTVVGPMAMNSQAKALPQRDGFDTEMLRLEYSFLREPPNVSWLSLSEKPGYLTLTGRKPFTSHYDQSLIARRLDSYHAEAETALEFDPETYRHMAGLICYYDTKHFYYLNLTYDERRGVEILSLKESVNGRYMDFEIIALDSLQAKRAVGMRMRVEGDSIIWSYKLAKDAWEEVAQKHYLGNLADEQKDKSGFTGAMVGLCAQDLLYERKKAHFDYFEYSSRE